MWKEFKQFAMKGNVVDLAVGVVIGGAFGKIVSSLVSDIVMPLIGLLVGRLDFTNWFIPLKAGNFNTLEEAKKAGVATINYGVFLNNVLDFLIIAFSIFIVIKQINRFTRKKEAPEPAPAKTKLCKYCYSEIHVDATRCPHCTSEVEA
ncbi:large conductance mechanosensitive channel protein MscL [Clostridium sp. YIM B02515]|uniref:Large-conductance mechanosensitive channel n=1 Tax=Clostridium rhizosphaerae TaxID=2803861 RepID=A0ABS1T4E5_9CLOT|nr:large conductance mechanosensitive channel protein MscL [Clostridium rhizosphaerae]MBL4934202.1 large conductance mechanosensitive channel protein MscL [Clostridium rhizosphaerae]